MKARKGELGSALILAVVVVIIVIGIGGAFLFETVFRGKTQFAMIQSDEAQVVCDAGLEFARRVLLEKRRNDPSGWNTILQYCIDRESAVSKQTVEQSPTVPEPTSGYVSQLNDWFLTNPERIKAECLQDLRNRSLKTIVDSAYSSGTTNVHTGGLGSELEDVPIDKIFCRSLPFVKGAYHIVVRDNLDWSGDGMDEDADGDAWDVDGNDAKESSLARDGDRQMYVIVTATLPDGTQRQIEAFVEFPPSKFVPGNAILADGNVYVYGSAQQDGVLGQSGSIHGNGTVYVRHKVVSQTINAVGTVTYVAPNNAPVVPPENIHSGAETVDIPRVDMNWYLTNPTLQPYIVKIGLDASGNAVIKSVGGGFAAGYIDPTQAYFKYQSGAYVIDKVDPPSAIYYFEGDFNHNGGGNYQMTILSAGSIDIGGNAEFRAFSYPATGKSCNTLAVAAKDVKLHGTSQFDSAAANYQYHGSLYAGEQVDVNGNFGLYGAAVAANAPNTSGSYYDYYTVKMNGACGIVYDGQDLLAPPPAQLIKTKSVRRMK